MNALLIFFFVSICSASIFTDNTVDCLLKGLNPSACRIYDISQITTPYKNLTDVNYLCYTMDNSILIDMILTWPCVGEPDAIYLTLNQTFWNRLSSIPIFSRAIHENFDIIAYNVARMCTQFKILTGVDDMGLQWQVANNYLCKLSGDCNADRVHMMLCQLKPKSVAIQVVKPTLVCPPCICANHF